MIDHDADPTTAHSVEAFAQRLRSVRLRADNISYRDLERWGRQHGQPLPRSTVLDALSGKRLPRTDVVVAFLTACGIPTDDQVPWLTTWRRIAQSTQRTPQQRPSPDTTAEATTEAARIIADAIATRRTLLADLAEQRAAAEQAIRQHHLSAQLAADAETAGLTRIGTKYLNDLDWPALFTGTRELDIFVAYGQTWRNLHAQELDQLAARPDSRIRVFLPDIDDSLTTTVLADRFSLTPDELITRVTATHHDYAALARPGGGTIDVRYWRGDRLFSFYRLDTTAIIGFYSHTRTRLSSVPVLVCSAPGEIYQFISDELHAIEEQSRPA